jgi:hypothetical protein
MTLYDDSRDQILECEILNLEVSVIKWAWEAVANQHHHNADGEKFCVLASLFLDLIERKVADLNEIGLKQLQKENTARAKASLSKKQAAL